MFQVETAGVADEKVVEKSSADYVDATARARAKARATTYDRRKTVAHGMMDTALVSANANQLKFIIQYYRGRDSVVLAVLVLLIALSLTIQIAVGIALIFKHKKRNKSESQTNTNTNSSRLNINADDFIIVGVFFVIIINIFIAAFSTEVPNN